MQITNALIAGTLLALATSAAATAQERMGISAKLALGTSGSSAGMISGGGTAASSLDAIASTSTRSGASRSRADADASADPDTGTRTKAKKKRSSGKASGFRAFGARGYARSRD